MAAGRRWLACAAVVAVALACGHKRAGLEGRLEYMDSRWDPGTPSSAVPAVLVHLMPGTEVERRAILLGYRDALGKKALDAPEPLLVDHILAHHVPEGAIVEAVQVDADGGWAFERLPAGPHLVFAEYVSDLGRFAWIETVTLQGTRTSHLELTYQNRLHVMIPRFREPYLHTPPPLEIMDNPKLLEEHLQHNP